MDIQRIDYNEKYVVLAFVEKEGRMCSRCTFSFAVGASAHDFDFSQFKDLKHLNVGVYAFSVSEIKKPGLYLCEVVDEMGNYITVKPLEADILHINDIPKEVLKKIWCDDEKRLFVDEFSNYSVLTVTNTTKSRMTEYIIYKHGDTYIIANAMLATYGKGEFIRTYNLIENRLYNLHLDYDRRFALLCFLRNNIYTIASFKVNKSIEYIDNLLSRGLSRINDSQELECSNISYFVLDATDEELSYLADVLLYLKKF